MATRSLFLGNDYDIRRTSITARGVAVNGVTARGLLALTEAGEAIDPTLETTGTITAGEYLQTVQGYDLTEQLLALWDAAQAEGRSLYIYERVIVDDEDYSDVVRLRVERDRPPTESDA